MRGKQRPTLPPIHARRIIPAHAGQTDDKRWYVFCSADHPRACGANPLLSVLSGAPRGSSPRMRGKLDIGVHYGRLCRIIPAHAGQTSQNSPILRMAADHPRACGANLCRTPCRIRVAGSSPRMRGKQMAWQPADLRFRIIPAHAGQTQDTTRSM